MSVTERRTAPVKRWRVLAGDEGVPGVEIQAKTWRVEPSEDLFDALADVFFRPAGVKATSGVLGQAIGDAAFVRSAKTIGAARALPLSSSAPLLTLLLAALPGNLGALTYPGTAPGRSERSTDDKRATLENAVISGAWFG